jgi:hypothetical protein
MIGLVSGKASMQPNSSSERLVQNQSVDDTRAVSATRGDAAGTAALLIIQSVVLALLEKQALTGDEIIGALDDVVATLRGAEGIEADTARLAEAIAVNFLDRVVLAMPVR